jgi:UDP-N-acetylglucosamine 4,6-dehydratase
MEALENTASGQIYIPKMPALSIGKLAQYTVGVQAIEAIPMRPGEKMHEVLVTCEEAYYSIFNKGTTAFILSPTTSPRHSHREGVIDWMESGYYSSDGARELSRDELIQLLTDE